MSTIAERTLSECVAPKSQFRKIEPHVYSVAPDNSLSNTYDTDFGNIYEWVACNPIYNRVVWGYPITLYPRFTFEALSSASTGPVLDLACGSLAFTAKAYLQSPHRTIICSDQSLKMLRLARNRLVSLHGKVPDNVVFLLADALQLPLLPRCITTVVCLNLLHCIAEVPLLLRSLDNLVAPNSNLFFTTLVHANRWADRYLIALAKSGMLIPRQVSDHARLFQEAGMRMNSEVRGNLAFLRASANQAL
jgi:SAM-dependent methyltransferase